MAREIGYLISRVNLLSNRLLNRLLIDAQVTAFNSEQGKLLYVLWQEDGITVSALAEETNLALNTVSRMLLTMEASGLVTRVPDADDRRIKRVFLTEKGRVAQHDAVPISKAMEEQLFEGFSDDELDQLEGLLRRLVANSQKQQV
jgi:DNA-binding MarR family transcriptional regulator